MLRIVIFCCSKVGDINSVVLCYFLVFFFNYDFFLDGLFEGGD